MLRFQACITIQVWVDILKETSQDSSRKLQTWQWTRKPIPAHPTFPGCGLPADRAGTAISQQTARHQAPQQPCPTWGISGIRISPSSTYTKGGIIPRRQGWLLTSQPRRWAGRSSDVFRWQRDFPQLMSQRGVCNWTRRPRQFGITISGYSKEKGGKKEN